AELFGIRADVAELKAAQDALAPLFQAKRLFVQRRALKAVKPAEAESLDANALAADYESRAGAPFDELDFSRRVLAWMDDEAAHGDDLALAAKLCAALALREDRNPHSRTILFKRPGKHDPLAMVPACQTETAGVPALVFADGRIRHRDGFGLTDAGPDLATALDHINYCVLCHHQGRDSCTKGLKDPKTGETKVNAVGMAMAGCPLEEKISEMHEAKTAGHVLSALAIVAVDNPMAAGTGHRICNDCMVACVYQNQNRDPVNVPEAESRVLRDVLELPYGFEIYSLLTRWNPMNLERPLPAPPSGRKVLVVGLGPAGYTLAHHLIQDGHAVAAIDGLKIEPLPPEVCGVDDAGNRVPFQPLKTSDVFSRPLDERPLAGFGGVAEYGITVRWNKNFLDILRLLLERRTDFLMFGGVRFGGNLTLEQALDMGFDHVALATGAGKPTILDIPNNLARGVRQASDFLMALQLTGAAKADSLANLQLRLPVVVIGGGLTAIDTCTEALAYYPVQVEKFLRRFEAVAAEKGNDAALALWRGEDRIIADEFLAHARALRAERARAAAAGEAPRLLDLLKQWGGATIAYRRRLVDSPAYRNHEEVTKAMEEGILFAERLTPVAVVIDDHGSASALTVQDADGARHDLPARSILVAAGTVPNTTMSRERGGITLDGKYFQAVDEDGTPRQPEWSTKPEHVFVLMQVGDHDRRVSFFGDLHPSYAGNVVSAMASARQGYPVIRRAMDRLPRNETPWETLRADLNRRLRATVVAVNRLTPTIVEVVVKAPGAAANFQPGQFFRLQNYEAHAARTADTVMAMEGLALTGAWTDPDQGHVGLIVLEMGGSSSLCDRLREGEPVVLMGPTGTPTTIAGGETVLLAGGGLGNAVLFSIGAAFRAAGSKVIYFAGYKSAADRFKVPDIEAAADQVVWCVDSGDPFAAGRPQDRSFVGNIVEAMVAYGEGRLGERLTDLGSVDRLIAIGSDRMMAAVTKARHGPIAPLLKPGHAGIGSINAPMQCMMKEICAQCLQRHVDPETGDVRVVFSCFDQDQPLDMVDFASLAQRLGQNAASERLAAAWIDRSLNQI
ncbi:MAG: FAD-dependent oxidoreductase, partial [Rhodobacterales bacterium]|nr:FAD-dependent oxidoreductase [Rhodobacterales bacterium]